MSDDRLLAEANSTGHPATKRVYLTKENPQAITEVMAYLFRIRQHAGLPLTCSIHQLRTHFNWDHKPGVHHG